MKNQELFKILVNNKVIYDNLTENEMFDAMDELSSQFYETGVPNPEDIMVEYGSNMEN